MTATGPDDAYDRLPGSGARHMSSYVVTFDRISRNHNVPPLNVKGGPNAIAEQVWKYARSRCASRDIDVAVDMEAMAGTIYAGWHVAGTFTLEATP